MIYDVIVIGLGAMGSAAVYQLSKRKIKVLGIDRFAPPHKFGSTHGETRVTRQAIGEGAEYVPFALRSYEIFREIERETGADLLAVTGGLIISSPGEKARLHGSGGFIEETAATARRFGVKHRTLNADEIRREFPQFNLKGDEIGYFEDEMGFLRPEKCVAAQLGLAESSGAEIRRDERVVEIKTNANGVSVVTDKNVYHAEKAIVSVGAWIENFVGRDLRGLFKVYRQVFYWFDVAARYEKFRRGNFPIFIWEFGRWENDFFYGFPAIDGASGGLKIATETYFETTDPDRVKREVSKTEIEDIFDKYVRDRIEGVSPRVVKTATCLYTVAPNARFLIDKSPDDERVIVASPCSGHGFKHSAAIGEALAQLALDGKSGIDISAFSFERFL